HLFFFFQAEDGIRDRNVTGVQTCALPIYRARIVKHQARQARPRRELPCSQQGFTTQELDRLVHAHRKTQSRLEWRHLGGDVGGRSEERRVGKEGRWGWGWER